MKFLSAPWRWEFIRRKAKDGRCLFCRALEEIERDSLVCFRGRNFFVLLNKYPYATGHLMVAPCAHLSSPFQMAAADLGEMWELTRRAMAILQEKFHPDGFNIGMNIGRAAGAGVEDHFHQHVVPRWHGDANFMATVGRTKVMSYDLEAVRTALRTAFAT
ncbi:MAG: HIT domain-containing protein [Candidatus Aminicenantes bacterium]|nr:HIT domain-containing protein [Candidatus Aminicenantes bacterium]